ncbi:hypothetical protein DBT82_RS23395 [Vibrio parahaemolyticus]|nr:hypothetical protein [Vibrio parahaemolyticus]EJG0350902.1 hypothetical protein [Vibrio parahaemolyticus]EJG0554606.1 hypothetical protein [Vibrio parahaemolyticus]MBM5084040.1 hypothetical protein [Vibrio parahaemolyticus]
MMVINTNKKLRPVDKTARLVTSEAPKDSVYKIKNRDKLVDLEFWESPRKHQPLPVNSSFKDFTGVVIGRLTVYGYLGNASWQCRCTCGRYCSRRKKFIEQVIAGRKSTESMCRECFEVMQLKKKEFFKANNRYPTDAEKYQL